MMTMNLLLLPLILQSLLCATLTRSEESASEVFEYNVWPFNPSKYAKTVDFAQIIIEDYSQNGSTLSASELRSLIECVRNGDGCNSKYARPNALANSCEDLHGSDKSKCLSTNSCISSSNIAAATHKYRGKLSVSDLKDICPFLLLQAQYENCETLDTNTSHLTFGETARPSTAEVWGYSFLFVTIINITSILGVLLMPCMNKKLFHDLLAMMIGLAAGSLAASALFHLLPAAFNLEPVGGRHKYLWMSLGVAVGAWSFFLVERLINIVTAAKQRRSNKASREVCESLQIESPSKSTGEIDSVAWMIIFGDGFHNFIDGVSIGAAFTESTLTGLSICLAVFCEELPHELGDFAVLLKCGMSIRQAVGYNVLSACTCYVGLIIGIILGEVTENSSLIFALAGGMFLYIAFTDMFPEMNEMAEKASKKGIVDSLKILLLQNFGLVFGVVILFTLAYYQDEITL